MSKGGTTTSTSSIDPQIKEAFLANFQQAQGVAGALPVQQFAGYNPMYQAGEEALVNTGLAGPGITGTDLAAQMAAYGGVYQPAQIQAVRTNLGLGGGQMAMPQMAMPQMAMPQMAMPQMAMPQSVNRAPKTEADWNQFQSMAQFAPGTDMDAAKAEFMGGGGQAFGGPEMGAYNPAAGQQMQPQMQMQQPQNIRSIAEYMNPFTSQVRANALGDLEAARQAAIQQTGERANAARAFGGSRQGVAEALTNQGFAKQAATLGTTLNEQAFNQAMAMQQADIARQSAADIANQQAGLQGAQLRLGGASQLGNLAAQQQALRLGGAQAVMGAGGARQALDQQQMDAIRNIGLQRLGVVQSSLGAQPANLGMQSTTPQYSNPAAGALGGALAGSKIAGPYGAVAGGILGLLGG